ncbi:hypothetical protein RhiirC2_733003 [Rhizophagus irregularis]|uniref:F-box domain-containing protein n=1 Tax=Rhizophagus irregularis TaxID=588596 RepID=A0A2N1NSU7_9GLOM|nr:hypothetical protein RhiirC2_733003 [Rhizophagus irregularis]
MTPTLPGDCLLQILSYLADDSKSLYAFLRVNRLWCVNAIKYLWKQPFQFALILKSTPDYTSHHRRKTGKLTETFITCLIHNEIISGGSIQNKKRTSARVPLVSPPLFNYVGFIRKLDLDDLGLAIAEWAEYIFSPKYNRDASSVKLRNAIFSVLIQQKSTKYTSIKNFRNDNSLIGEITMKIYKLLMNQIPKLDCLSMKPGGTDRFFSSTSELLKVHLEKGAWFNHITKENMSIIHYPRADVCLANLVEFEWKILRTEATTSEQFLIDLSQICTKIQRIEFDMNKPCRPQDLSILEALKILIESQTCLEEFELKNCILDSHHIMVGLNNRVNTLKRLIFRQVNSLKLEFISGIANLYNLEELRYYGGSMGSKDAWPLSFTHFPVLKVYEIDDLFPTAIAVNPDAMVSNYCPALRTFIYNQRRYYRAESTSTIIGSIGVHCENLRHFECNAEICSITILQLAFMASPNLERIILTNDRLSLKIDELLMMARLKKLKYLELNGSWNFKAESLYHFLVLSQPPLSTIILSKNSCFEDPHLEVLLNCLEGVLTTFHLTKMTKRLGLDMRRQAKDKIEYFLCRRKTNIEEE